MADVNKSIEISYRADLKQLLNELKRIPGMTEDEAKKMVSQLNRQLKQAERASKKTGQATARGMKQVQRATQSATVSMKNFRTSARSADRVFGELSTGLELVSPELGALAGFASQASSGIEALGRAIGSANPIFLAITVAAGVAAVAYQLFAVDAEAVEEQAKKTTQRLKELSDATAGIVSAANRSATELAVLKGDISELDAAIVESEFKIRTESEKGLEAQQERIRLLEEGLELIDRRSRATEALTEEETNNLLALEKSIPVLKGIGDLDATRVEGVQVRLKAQERLNSEIEAEKAVLADLERSVDVQVDQQIELLEFKEEQKRADEALRKAEKERAAAARKAAADERAAINAAKKAEAERAAARNALEAEQRAITLKQLDDAEKVIFTYTERIHKIREATSALEDQSETESIVNQLRIEGSKEYYDTLDKMAQDAHDKELERAKEIEQAIQRQRDLNLAAASTIVSSASASITAIGQIMEEQGKMTKQQMISLFRANQAAAISEIAVNTAVAVTRAYRDLGPIGGVLATGALLASGAAQTAAVAMQKPPSFHMGGVVPPANAPDERNIQVLAGEAVLDRSTVDRIGGQSGVDALQNGEGMKPTVIVMNPFKHLDRYNRSALKRNSALSGAFRKTRVYGAGGY